MSLTLAGPAGADNQDLAEEATPGDSYVEDEAFDLDRVTLDANDLVEVPSGECVLNLLETSAQLCLDFSAVLPYVDVDLNRANTSLLQAGKSCWPNVTISHQWYTTRLASPLVGTTT